MQIDVFVRRLPFIFPFTISGGRTKTEQPAIIVRMSHQGKVGYGEVGEITYYQTEAQAMAEKISSLKNLIEESFRPEPEEFYKVLWQLFPTDSFIRCAIDMAAWDLYGKTIGKSVSQIIYGIHPATVLTDYTLGIDKTEQMMQKMRNMPWPVYKMKVGFEGDSETFQALSKVSGAKFRMDANAAWSVNAAIEFLSDIEGSMVEIVEQPLSKTDFKGMLQLKEILPFQFFADEACVAPEDVEKCKGYFHGINIKLSKCGGITPAVGMIQNARQNGLKIMLGNMNESSIGTAALLQLASQVDYVDADGPLLLAKDNAQGVEFQNGYVKVSSKPGLGIEVYSDLFD